MNRNFMGWLRGLGDIPSKKTAIAMIHEENHPPALDGSRGIKNLAVSNWLVGQGHPSEKYEFVNWDGEIPNVWENKIDVPNHQPGKSRTLET